MLTSISLRANNFGLLVENDSVHHNKLAVSVGFLSMLDVYNGSSYRFGLQIRPINQIAFGGEMGGFANVFSKLITPFYKMKGYHYRLQLRFYPMRTNNLNIGIEFQYRYQRFSYLDSTAVLPTFEATVAKNTFAYNLFLGYDYQLSKRIFIGTQLSVGVRYRDILNTRSDVVESGESLLWPWDSMTTGRVTSGQNFIPNFNLAIRMSFAFF